MQQPLSKWLRQPGGLADRLKKMREATGLTGDEFTARLGWANPGKLRKLENGHQMPSEDDLRQWAEAAGRQDELPGLLQARETARAEHTQWKHQLRAGQAALQTDFDQLVRDADRIRDFQMYLIPGLLQTPGYARYRALEATRLHGTDPDKVDDVVAARMLRQRVLADTSKRFEFLLTEAAFRYLLCPPDVMAAQLYQLQGVIGLAHVRLGIIPPGRELAVCPMIGFLMADEIVVLETFTSADTLRDAEAAKHGEIMDAMWADAAEGEDARQLIMAAADDLRRLRPSG